MHYLDVHKMLLLVIWNYNFFVPYFTNFSLVKAYYGEEGDELF